MKYVKNQVIVILIFIILLSCGTNVSAMEPEITTKEMNSHEKEKMISDIDITFLETEPVQRAIKCFYVNEKDMIAIGTSNSQEKTICIYNSEGIYQYGYRFRLYGNYGIMWHEDNIVIYFVDSNILVEIDESGNVKNMSEVQDTADNNTYIQENIFATIRTVGNHKYKLENNMGFLNFLTSSYSQLVVVDERGEENIIYDVNASELSKMIIAIAAEIIFIGVVVYCLVRYFRMERKKQ